MPVSGNINNQSISPNPTAETKPASDSENDQVSSRSFKGRDVKSRSGQKSLRIHPEPRDGSIKDKSIKASKRTRPFLHKKQVAGGVTGGAVAGGAIAGAMYSRHDYDSTVQPPLGATEAEEYAIFKNLMAPYKDLPDDQKQKAVLVLMQDRIREHITYGADIDTEGVQEYDSSPAEILADNGQGIDCEDYAIMCERWCGYAKAEGLLPQESNTYVLIVDDPGSDDRSTHAIFVYESGDTPPERYVIDTFSIADEQRNTNAAEWFDNDLDSNGDDVVSFDEYFANTDYQLISELDISYDPNRPGSWSFSDYVASEQWLSEGSSSNNIGASISHRDLIARQAQWLEQGNSLGLPEDFQENIQNLEHQIDLIEAQQLLGKQELGGGTISADDLELSTEQRTALIGQYSEHYRRPFTAEDLDLHSETPGPEMPELESPVEAVELIPPPYDLSHPDLVEHDAVVEGVTPDYAGSEKSIPTGMHDTTAANHAETLASDSGGIAQNSPATHTDHLALLGFNPELYTDAAQLGTEIAAGVVESAFVAAFAQRKLYRLKKRQAAIEGAHKIRTEREKELFDQLIKPGSIGIISPGKSAWVVQHLLKKDGRTVSAQELHDLIRDLHNQFQAPLDAGELSQKRLKAMGVTTKKVVQDVYQLSINNDKLYRYLKTNSLNFPNLFNFSQNGKIVNKKQFRQYADLCFINDSHGDQKVGNPNAALGNILKQRDCYVEHNNLTQLLDGVLRLNSSSGHAEDAITLMGSPLTSDDMGVLNNFRQALQTSPQETMQNISRIKAANKVLDKLGIHIDFRRDKFLGSLRKGSKAIYQQVRIKPDKFFTQVKNMGQLPMVQDLDRVLSQHSDNIDALHTLKNYDQWKIHQHKRDRDLKLASAITGFLPLSLGVDEVLKAVAYGREAKYRDKNRAAMNDRIDDTLVHLKGENDKSRGLKALLALDGQELTAESLGTISQSLTNILQRDGAKKQQTVLKTLAGINSRLTSGSDLELDEKEYKKLQKQLDSLGINIADHMVRIKVEKLTRALRKKELTTVAEPMNTDGTLKQYGWQQGELDQLATMLENARKVKSGHMDIKTSKATINSGIHTAAFVADPFSTVMGPAGRAIKAGAKVGAKTGVTITAAIDRQRGDKKLRAAGTFSEPKEIYRFYKALYLNALKAQQAQKADSIQRLAQVTFGVTAQGFDALVKTELVENNRFKLSFSRN